ncbi:MAG: hypothetical protein U1E53_21110 [Dongiaceae bacterium]
MHGVVLCGLAAFYAVTAWVARHPQVDPLYRDHYIRHATTDWQIRRTDRSIADGIDFSQDGVYPREVDHVLGLSWPEPAGRWSEARRWPVVSVLLRAPVSGQQCLDLRFNAARWQVGLPVTVRLGDAVATLRPADGGVHDYAIPLTATVPAAAIDIEPSNPSRPAFQDHTGDLRRLAVMLHWLRLRPGPC